MTQQTLEGEPNPFELPKALSDAVFYESLEEPKQETLEAAAEWLNKKFNGKGVEVKIIDWGKNEMYNYTPTKLLEEYSKWQQERMYSEDDLREAFRQGENNVGYNSKYGYTFKLTEKEWFEQFKKK